MTTEFDRAGDSPRETTRRSLHELRTALLRLHKRLLEIERIAHERVYGRVSAGELLRLSIEHKQFVWLRPVSEIIVRIDQLLGDEERMEEHARLVLSRARNLFVPAESGTPFARNYYLALQSDPDTVLAHRAVSVILAGAAGDSK
jgi:hypothetical protein